MHDKTKIAVLVCGFCILAIALSIIVVRQNEYTKEQAKKTALLVAQKAENDKKEAARSEFDKLLNNLIKDLSIQSKAYTKQRIILKEVIHPLNFEKPEFAQESYSVFKNEIIPMLRKSADQIIELFQIYDNKAQEMLKLMPSDLKTELQNSWQDMKKKQLDAYVSFFSKEEQIIQAHHDLMKFYATHSDAFILDEAGEHLIFDSPDDEAKEKRLRQNIKTLQSSE